jgi:hypothetical protein
VEVGKPPRTALVDATFDSDWFERRCEAADTPGVLVGRETLCRELW